MSERIVVGMSGGVDSSVAAALLADGGGDETPGPEATDPVRLSASSSYDPHGDDGSEHESEVGNATDGNPSTAWRTSSYRFGGGSLGKPGVGIIVTTGQPRELASVTVTTETPGYTAEIRVGEALVDRFAAGG